MPILQWSDKYSVKVKELDDQHRKLIDLVNELHDGMSSGKSREVMGGVLDGLVKYTVGHFATEEQYMSRLKYPGELAHKAEHKKLVDQVAKFQKDYQNGQAALSLEIMNFLKSWLTGHIQSTDMKYSQFFNEKGIK